MQPKPSLPKTEYRAVPRRPAAVIESDLSRRSLAKADPYASRAHRQIDLVLLAITVLILFLILHGSAHGRPVRKKLPGIPTAALTFAAPYLSENRINSSDFSRFLLTLSGKIDPITTAGGGVTGRQLTIKNLENLKLLKTPQPPNAS